jgi:Holliday junction resolvase RusA-like endonuclease
MISVIAIGDPAPQGSKRAFINRRTGKPVIVESAVGHKDWREAVKQAALEQLLDDHEPMTGAIDIDLVFKMRRPKTVTRHHPYVAPDLDKLCRSVFDSLTNAGVWRDDCHVCNLTARKEYTDFSPGVWIYVYQYGEERIHQHDYTNRPRT